MKLIITNERSAIELCEVLIKEEKTFNVVSSVEKKKLSTRDTAMVGTAIYKHWEFEIDEKND